MGIFKICIEMYSKTSNCILLLLLLVVVVVVVVVVHMFEIASASI